MQGIRILIVDDSLFFREVVSRGIMASLPAGSTIEKAGNPFEARDKILSFDPDVMVLDVEMPRMNGIEFLRRLMAQYDLPTIVLSSRPAYRDVALEAGAYGFMPKPATTEGISFMKELAANIMLVYEKHKTLVRNAQSSSTQPKEEPARFSAHTYSVNSGANSSNLSKTSQPAENLSPLQRMLQSAKKSGFLNTKGQPLGGTNTVSNSTSSYSAGANRPMRRHSPIVGKNNMDAVVSSMKTLAENAKVHDTGRKKTSAVVPAVAPKPRRPVTLIAMGASTGGTEALAAVLKDLKPPLPPIVIVQHIPPMFSRLFAERLENECQIHVKEAENGDKLEDGWAYVAPGDKQMAVKRMGNMMSLECYAGEKVNGHMPSVDVLFNSVAERIGDAALGVILTGMGEDGARGMLKMRQAGSITIGQDEESCVVYGMPKAAFEMGAVSQQLPLSAVAGMVTSIAGYQGR